MPHEDKWDEVLLDSSQWSTESYFHMKSLSSAKNVGGGLFEEEGLLCLECSYTFLLNMPDREVSLSSDTEQFL